MTKEAAKAAKAAKAAGTAKAAEMPGPGKAAPAAKAPAPLAPFDPAAPAFKTATEAVEIGGRAYTIAALPCGAMRRVVLPLALRLEGDGGGGEGGALRMLGEMLDVCLMSLSHADPGATREAIEDCLTLADAAEMFAHVVRVSTKPRG